MSAAASASDPTAIAVRLFLHDIVHEVRRASVYPIFRIFRGQVAPCHEAALAFGWLAPAPLRGRLAPTEAGRRALADWENSR